MDTYLEHLPDRLSSSVAFGSVGLGLIVSVSLLLRSYYRPAASEKWSAIPDLPLAPGPRPLPIIGNLLDVPSKREWETITKWGHQYGDIVRIRVLGKEILFVQTVKAANDLFDKRSAIYSDRPRLPLVNELMQFDWSIPFMPYNETWKRQRKMFVSQFGPTNAHAFQPIQEYCTAKFLHNLVANEGDFIDHIRLLAGQQILQSTYGIKVESQEDRFIRNVQTAIGAVSDAARPGLFIVDAIPFLKKLPEWFPGTSWKRLAREGALAAQEMRIAPFLAAKSIMTQENSHWPMYVREVSERFGSGPDVEVDIKDSAAVAYGAGADTTVAALTGFMLAMVLYPDAQRKGQAEIDAVIGNDRLPTFEDMESLPYVTAIVKESLRWHTISPQALPHQLREDDVYNGYFIHAGTIVVGNTWGILHDPETYPEPMNFIPERYFDIHGDFDNAKVDPVRYVFGYGRRVCGGYRYAENTMWITIASVLAALNVGHTINDEGRPIPVEHDYLPGVVCHPKPFKCSITPRSAKALDLINQANSLHTC